MNFQTQNTLYSTADIKREAKAQLSGNWKDAVLMALIPTFFSFVFYYLLTNTSDNDFVSFLFDIIHGFLVTGVTFGFMNLLRNRNYVLRPFQEVASPFRSNYFKNLLLLHLLKYLFIFLWALLFVIPGIVKAYSYSQAELIYKDRADSTGQQPDARECLRESQRLMKGNKADLFLLDLSFIGWMILNAITLGILGLWLTPYTTMSRVIFYENLTDGRYQTTRTNTFNKQTNYANNEYEEVGKNPDDFRDFDDF